MKDEASWRSQENYRSLAESSPDAIFILSRELAIEYINRAGAAWTGRLPAEMVGRSFVDFFPPEIAVEYERSLRQVFTSGEPLSRERKTVLAGREKIVETRLLPLASGTGEVMAVMGVSRDMTEQRHTEARLRRREEWGRELLEHMREGLIRMDMDGRILDANDAYCQMSGYSREELLTMKVSQLSLTDPTDDGVRERIGKIVQTGSVRFETRHRRKDGTVIYLESLVTYIEAEGKHILVLSRDITDRKQLEQEIVRISAHERQRIGYDLHDGLGQHLTGVAFKTKVLEEDLAAISSPEVGRVKEIVGLINQAIAQTRALARSLAPVEVEVNGLLAAFENLAAETRRSFLIDCRLACELAVVNLNSEVSTTFYRIAQEAIHNAIRHGGADVVTIEIGRSADDFIFLKVRDDGKGFSPATSKPAGMGLRIMRYRASSIGGSLQVVSAPGQGAEISCQVAASKTLEEA